MVWNLTCSPSLSPSKWCHFEGDSCTLTLYTHAGRTRHCQVKWERKGFYFKKIIQFADIKILSIRSWLPYFGDQLWEDPLLLKLIKTKNDLFFPLPNMKAVCLCVWVWGQHYKYDFRISGSLRSTAIGCLFLPSPLVIFFFFWGAWCFYERNTFLWVFWGWWGNNCWDVALGITKQRTGLQNSSPSLNPGPPSSLRLS